MQTLAIGIYVIVILFVYLVKMKINIPEDLSKRKSLEIITNIVLSFFFIIPNIFSMLNGISIVSKELFVYNSVALLSIISLNIFNAIKLTNMEVIKNDMEFQKIYIETLNNAIDSLKGFKHDYNNIVQSIGGYLMINDIDGLKRFYHHMLAECKKVNNIFPLNNYIKECPPIYGILLSKIYYSEANDVLLEINVSSKINIPTIKLYDLSKILGILLDNAIEAAAESKKKYVEFIANESHGKNKLVIEIINSFDSTVNVEKIFQDGFTTKKEHTGFGLSEVKKILSKYKNCTLYTKISDNIFTHKIEIGFKI
jgi:two-component system sensor histidine kinase AgrC